MSALHPDVATAHAPLNTFISNLVAGLICGFLAVVLSIGRGSLLFAGELSGFLPIGIGMALLGTAVVAALGAVFSSRRGLIAVVHDIPAVALSATLLAVAAALPPDVNEPTVLVTVVVATGLATAVTGLFFLLLGHFRLGRLIRFAPYPVVGGFLAGTGWLIMSGGIGLVINRPFHLDVLSSLGDTGTLAKLAMTAGFVLLLVLLQRGKPSPLRLPIIISIALFAFNTGAFGLHIPTEELRAEGWLVRLPEHGGLWPPISPSDLGLVDWSAVVAGLTGLPAMILLTVAAFLMNATAIELGTQRDIDLDRELKAAGVMNLFTGASGGLPGYCSISLSVLATRLDALQVTAPLVVAGVAAAALFFGGEILDWVPTVLLGGFLIWVGGSLLVEWLLLSYRRLQLREYLVIPLIFVIIVGVDFALGILTGLVAAVVLFAFEYGRLDIVRHEMSGARYQSSVETTDRRRQALEEFGSAILIVRLQGFLFFGTADGLRQRILERVTAEPGRTKFLIIDFGRVTGIDSSSVLSFIRLHQVAARDDLTVVLAGVGPAIMRSLRRGGLGEEKTPRFKFEPDLERGLKWCEDKLLSESAPELLNGRVRRLNELLSEVLGNPRSVEALVPYFSRVEAEPGTRLIEQGSPSDDIILVESGHAGVELMSEDSSAPLRLAAVGPGAIVGEISFYLQEPRTASIVVEEPLVAWRFTREALASLQAEAPAAALDLHSSIAAMLARRLGQTHRLLRILAD